MSTLWPFLVIGLFSGSLYGLAAMGVVLTYKTTGIFNFAYGAVAMFCAFAYWQLHDSWHITAWVSIPLLLLVVAGIFGGVFEVLFRPFAGLSAEIPMVITLAILSVLQVAAVLVWGGQERSLHTVFPRSTFGLGSSFHVGWDQLSTLLLSLAMGGSLWFLLRHTRFGTATRAVVDNGELARSIGVNTAAIQRAAWTVSSVFAALVGILLSPTQGLDVNQLVLVVIYAFAPAVVGFVLGLPWAFTAAIAMAVLQSVLSRWSSSGSVADLEASIPYLALFLLLVLLGGRLKEPGIVTRSSLAGSVGSGLAPRDSGSGSAGPASWSRRHRPLVLGASLFAAMLFLPLGVPGPRLGDVTIGVCFALIALTLVVLTGWTGQVSLAQFSFVGVGAFAVGHWAGAHGQNFLPAALAGMAIAAPLGLLLGLPSLRLRGLYFMLATFAFALIMDNLVFNRSDVSGGLTGMVEPRPRIFGVSLAGRAALFECALTTFGAVALAAYVLRRGPVGRRLLMLRDSPLAASTLGVNLTLTKLAVFSACGAVAALGGTLYGAQLQAIVPSDFQFSVSLELLLLVVLSGRSMITGAAIAGALFGIQHLPIPADVVYYISLGVAVGAIGLAGSPEGTVAIAVREARRCLSVLYPRPGRPVPLLVDSFALTDLPPARLLSRATQTYREEVAAHGR